jgi:hypothetical protein
LVIFCPESAPLGNLILIESFFSYQRTWPEAVSDGKHTPQKSNNLVNASLVAGYGSAIFGLLRRAA